MNNLSLPIQYLFVKNTLLFLLSVTRHWILIFPLLPWTVFVSWKIHHAEKLNFIILKGWKIASELLKFIRGVVWNNLPEFIKMKIINNFFVEFTTLRFENFLDLKEWLEKRRISGIWLNTLQCIYKYIHICLYIPLHIGSSICMEEAETISNEVHCF